MKTKTKEEMKEEVLKVYKDIVNSALKAYKATVEPASETCREECNRIEELPGPNPEEEIEVKGYRYRLIK